MDFNVKQHQESKQMKKELVNLNTETLCLSEATKVLKKTSLQENNISKIPASSLNILVLIAELKQQN